MVNGHVPGAVSGLTPLGRMDGTSQMNLAIGLPLRNGDKLASLLQDIYNPASPNFHHYLSTEQFVAQFGPTEADYEAVAAFAESHGLKVTQRHANRVVLDVSGTSAAVEQALHVKMQVYQHPTESRTFFAPDGNPSLDLGVPVLDISGLQNYSLPKTHLVGKPLVNGQNAQGNSGSGQGGTYFGKDFRAAYAPDTTMTGAGQAVGLLEFDGYYASDIANYESAAGLPSVTLSNVLLDGFSGNPEDGEAVVEVSLDIEMAISMAPGQSEVLVYEAGESGNWHDMLNRMADDNLAKQLSCSWYQDAGPDAVAEQIFQQMAAQGQSFFAACGDYDAYTGSFPFPDDSPSITLVGGTTLTTSGPQGSWVSEKVWNWGDGIGTGGGISTYYPIPSYQTNISMSANQGSTTLRNVPDVAFTADNVFVRANGTGYDEGGTSCAAPLWAGFTALINQAAVSSGRPTVGFINPAIDAIGSASGYTTAFHDITTGNNTSSSSPSKFYAEPGFDLCTGWGVPNGQALITALGTPDPLAVTPSSGFTAIGGSGGPFTQTAETFVLTNSGTNLLNWAAVNPSSWLNVSLAGGTLTNGGAAETVTVTLNSNAYAFPIGNYTSVIEFSDLTTTNTITRPFLLQVVPSVPPTIVTQPTNQTVFQDYNASFSVAVSGTPPLNYQWSDNGTNIDGATNASLELTNVGFGDVGSYIVTISNTIGTTNSIAAVLTVNPPPPCDPPPAGIVGWWPGNGNTYDVIGGETGIAGPGLTYTSGEVGQAFSFSPGSYVDSPASPALNVGTGSGLTVEFWVNPSDVSGPHPLVEWNNGSAYGTHVWESVGAPGVVIVGCIYINLVDTQGNAHFISSPGGLLAANQFAHVAATYDHSSGLATLYCNGAAVASTNLGVFTPQTSYDLWFGLRESSGQNFAGLIDEVSVYSRALSAGEISNIYAASFTGKCPVPPTPPTIVTQPANQTVYEGYPASFSVAAGGTPPLTYQWSDNGTNIAGATNAILTLAAVTLNEAGSYSVIVSNALGETNSADAVLTVNPTPPCDPAPSGIVSWWPGQSNALDIISGNNGTFVGNVGYVAGEVNEAFNFNGNSGYMVCSSSPSLNVGAGGGLTIEGWINPSEVGDQQPLMEWNNGSAYGAHFWISVATPDGTGPGCLYANLFDTGGTRHIITSASSVVSTGRFQHVAVTYDKTSGAAVLYYNGAMVASANLGNFTPQTTYNLYFNHRPTYTLAATMVEDEFSLYNRALSASEIFAIYSLGGTNGKCVPPPTGPIIINQPSNVVAAVGSSATFTVGAGGTQPLKFQWQFDTTNIPNATNASVTLANVQITNSGSYSVIVSNSLGSVGSSNAILVVGNAPVITNQPQSQTIVQGNSVSFSVGVSGTGPIDYQWSFGGIDLPGQTNAIYTVTNVQPANAGSYAVSVSSPFGSVLSSSAVLTVDSAPAIVTQPTNVTVFQGLNASFSVGVSGTAPFSYQWCYDGTNVITNATNATLTLTNVSYDEAGSYSVTISNLVGATNSAPAILTVNPPPPCDPAPSGIVGWWPGNGNTYDFIGGYYATAGNGLSYAPGEVGEAFSFSPGSYVESPASSALNVGTNSGLSIEFWFNPADVSGPHPLVEWNNGTSFGTHVWVSVAAPGVVSVGCIYINLVDIQGNQHYIASPGGVTAAGQFQHVAATYDHTSGIATLYCNGAVVASTNLGVFTPQTTYNLYFGFRPSSGQYYTGLIDEVSIYNRALSSGEVSNIYAAAFTGKCPPPPIRPTILTQPTNQTVYAGSTVQFSVAAIGTPPLTYQWSDDGTNIAEGTNAVLTLSDVSTNDSGSYTVTVSNGGGSTNSAAAVLTVNPAPPCDPPPVGIVGWWTGNGNAYDIVGGDNATASSGVSYGTGEVAQAFSFSPGSYVEAPATAALNVGTNAGITIEFWVDPADVSGPHPLLDWNNGATFGTHFWVSVAAPGVVRVGCLYFNLVDTQGNYHYLASAGGVLAANQFRHVAATYDHASGVATLYCNGAVVASQNMGVFTPQTSYNLFFGYRPSSGQYYTGLLDEVSVYNRALASNEIASIYAKGAFGKCTNELPPVFLTQPVSQTVLVGQTVNLSVTATGPAPLSYQWYFDKMPLAQQTNSSLILTNIQIKSAGSYYVTVSNEFGARTSTNAVLFIQGAPVIEGQPASRTISTQETATFTVYAYANPAATYQWQVNNVSVPGATNSTLVIPNAMPTDGGIYTVIISNRLGTATSTPATLLINYIAATPEGQPLQIATTNLTVPASVQPGNTFTVSSISPYGVQGGLVQLGNGEITYTAPPQFVGEDSFSYVLTPASGLAFTQYVTVLVNDSLILGASVSGGQATIQFAGVPEATYYIEASTNLTTWTVIGGATADQDGRFQFQDINAGLYPQRYYRSTTNP